MTIREQQKAIHYRWDDIPLQNLKGTITRRWVTTEQLMIAQVFFRKGDDVPSHSHVNEQITYIPTGTLKFWIGADEKQEVVVHAGELIVIPSNVVHRACALEDTLDIDIFNPPRQDWISGTDAYLRR
jgi:quercetin dioxygenase-like cupin family protein